MRRSLPSGRRQLCSRPPVAVIFQWIPAVRRGNIFITVILYPPNSGETGPTQINAIYFKYLRQQGAMAAALATVAAPKPACPAVRARGNSFTGKALMASGTDGGCTYFISVVNCSCSRYFESIQGDPVCWG